MKRELHIWILTAALLVVPNLAFGENKVSHFENAELNISFDYPKEWGDVIVSDYRSEKSQKEYLLKGGGLDWMLQFSGRGRPFGVIIRIGVFPDQAGQRIICYESHRDTTNVREIVKSIELEPSAEVGGCPAKVDERYFEPGGEATRIVTWSRGSFFYELTAAIPIFEIKNNKGKQGHVFTVTRLLEENPMNKELQRFAENLEQMVGSITHFN